MTKETIPMYNEQDFVLVCRKSDFEANNVGDGYFLVPKDEWFMDDNSIDLFHLLLTQFMGNQLKPFMTSRGEMVINQSLPLIRRADYMQITFD